MATARQIEKFFEDTVYLSDFVQGRDGFITLHTDDQDMVISAEVMPNSMGDMTNPKLVITITKR